ncbi:MAG TPA: OB-fold domain-containing protein [Sporichthyaceae bacterium]|nr:OB-fold domain-containing protein [Sporichthyaceae bacterium]
MTLGIVGYGGYLPVHRLAMADVAATLGSGSARGSRVVASYDEDSTTMAVAAARGALAGRRTEALWFATTNPAYAEKTNATAIHAALGQGALGFAVDMAGSPRSGAGALRAAGAAGGLAVLGDVRVGLPGSADERDGADGAAAFLFGPAAEALAVPIAHSSTSGEFLDRWRAPGEPAARSWEERFAVEMYDPLINEAVAAALAEAGLSAVDHVVVSGPHTRAVSAAATRHGAAEVLPLGHAGAADLGLRLADVLDRATPGQTVLTVSAVDGADVTVWRTTERVGSTRAGVRAQLEAGRAIPYATYLTWRGLLDREGPRRPEPERPAGPPAARNTDWKFAFVGSRCDKCGFVHLPPARVCASCRTVGQMTATSLADAVGTVVTYTVDRLAFSPSPPTINAVVDFDGGGRSLLELADARPDEVAIGRRVRLTFRRMYTAGGVHNYFWKARLMEVSDGQ